MRLSLIAATLPAALLLSSCSNGPRQFTSPDVSDVEVVAASAPDVSDVRRAIDGAASLSSLTGRLRSRCLEAQGHPELIQALAMRRPAAGRYRPAPLDAPLIEFGPSTAAEARTYGMDGTSAALDGGDHGTVVSRSRDFDEAGEHCDGWLYGELAPGLRELQSQAAAFAEQASNDYSRRVGNALTPLLIRRLECVRDDGYPLLRPKQALQEGSTADMLRMAGVVPGVVVPASGVMPSDQLVEEGKVRIFPPLGAEGYRPSLGEVDFALVYAECGRATGFVTAARNASAVARKAVGDVRLQEARVLNAEIATMMAKIKKA